jgi:hypothetical protein
VAGKVHVQMGDMYLCNYSAWEWYVFIQRITYSVVTNILQSLTSIGRPSTSISRSLRLGGPNVATTIKEEKVSVFKTGSVSIVGSVPMLNQLPPTARPYVHVQAGHAVSIPE